VKKGGILVRFAGPRLEKGGDDLLPVPLRLGGRTLGGALSWATPQPLAAFSDDSLVRRPDAAAEVLVNKQVWPTRRARTGGEGVGPPEGRHPAGHGRQARGRPADLLHVTANSDWSNLPLSGLFVEMLRPHRQPRRHGRRRRGAGRRRQGRQLRTRRLPRRCWRPCRSRRLRATQEPAADDAGHRRCQDRGGTAHAENPPATTAPPAARARST